MIFNTTKYNVEFAWVMKGLNYSTRLFKYVLRNIEHSADIKQLASFYFSLYHQHKNIP